MLDFICMGYVALVERQFKFIQQVVFFKRAYNRIRINDLRFWRSITWGKQLQIVCKYQRRMEFWQNWIQYKANLI